MLRTKLKTIIGQSKVNKIKLKKSKQIIIKLFSVSQFSEKLFFLKSIIYNDDEPLMSERPTTKFHERADERSATLSKFHERLIKHFAYPFNLQYGMHANIH